MNDRMMYIDREMIHALKEKWLRVLEKALRNEVARLQCAIEVWPLDEAIAEDLISTRHTYNAVMEGIEIKEEIKEKIKRRRY